MVRSNEEINAIITELKTRRDTRDAAVESAAASLDGSDDVNAAKLRSVNHAKEKLNDKTICVHDSIRLGPNGNYLFMYHTRYDFDDVTHSDGEIDKGLRNLLVDEAFTVTGSTTVENL